MMEIRINSIEQTIRIYGSCWYPTKIRGLFAVRIDDLELQDVEFDEGHVNSGEFIRGIYYRLPIKKWSLGKHFEKLDGKTIKLSGSKGEYDFEVRSTSIEFRTMLTEERDGRPFFRGPARLRGHSETVVEVYEPDGRGVQSVYLEGSLGALMKVYETILRDGSCALTDET